MRAIFEWMQGTAIAGTVGQSLELTAGLSAIHLLGLTLVVGSALVWCLGLSGGGRGLSASELTRGVTRVTAVGLAISVLSGVLLVAPRAVGASGSWIFQLKMALLAAAALVHLGVARLTRHEAATPLGRTLAGLLSLALWFGVAMAGSAFILLE